jgi:cobalt-zinc-cadmium efflux system protein
LSAHLTLTDGPAWPRVLASARRMLARDFGIDHVTLQPTWQLPPPVGRVIPLAPATGTDRESRE